MFVCYKQTDKAICGSPHLESGKTRLLDQLHEFPHKSQKSDSAFILYVLY